MRTNTWNSNMYIIYILKTHQHSHTQRLSHTHTHTHRHTHTCTHTHTHMQMHRSWLDRWMFISSSASSQSLLIPVDRNQPILDWRDGSRFHPPASFTSYRHQDASQQIEAQSRSDKCDYLRILSFLLQRHQFRHPLVMPICLGPCSSSRRKHNGCEWSTFNIQNSFFVFSFFDIFLLNIGLLLLHIYVRRTVRMEYFHIDECPLVCSPYTDCWHIQSCFISSSGLTFLVHQLKSILVLSSRHGILHGILHSFDGFCILFQLLSYINYGSIGYSMSIIRLGDEYLLILRQTLHGPFSSAWESITMLEVNE